MKKTISVLLVGLAVFVMATSPVWSSGKKEAGPAAEEKAAATTTKTGKYAEAPMLAKLVMRVRFPSARFF